MPNLGFFSYRANDDSSDNGPRTAAVLTFSGDTNDSFVKELTQNSLDARIEKNGNLKIKVRSEKLKKEFIPNFKQFESYLELMEGYWNSKSDQYKTFFKTARRSISDNNLNILIFEDYLTKGLEGNDQQGTFKNCVNDENVSGKYHSDSLGNHGIGKNSVFGYSGVHLVLYSSLNVEGEHKFKGVSKLGNYKDNNGTKRSERIYYGDIDGEKVSLVSEKNRIPEFFRRQEIGLSQFVIGAELNSNWEKNVIKAFISNYWFLLENGLLEVEVQGVELNRSNYHQLAKEYFSEDNSRDNPLQYIISYKEHQIESSKKIYKIGNVKLFLKEGEFFNNRIQFLRDGMKIKNDPLGMSGLPVSIAGVMYCDNTDGNSILGAMEPHAHDKFLPELVEKKQILGITVNDAKKILKEIDQFKKEELEKIRNKYTEEGGVIEAVDDIFSAIFGNGSGNSSGSSNLTENESFNRIIKKIDFNGVFSSNSKNAIINNLEEVPQGEGEGSGIGTGSGGQGLRGGDGKSQSQKGGSGNSEKSVSGKIAQNINGRFFISQTNVEQNIYKMILRSKNDYEDFDLTVSQYGDSGRKDGEMTSELIMVKNDDKVIPFVKVYNKKGQITGYTIKSLAISSDSTLVCDLYFKEKSMSALQITDLK